jgi:uridylate kinase
MGTQQYGIDPIRLTDYAEEIKEAASTGLQIAIVIGGGNIFRGMSGATKGFDRVKGDQMGMLATVINSLALQSALVSAGARARVYTAVRMEPVGELFSKDKVLESLAAGYVCIIAGGTGNPYFTTDTASALRGIELEADAMFKGTRVNGIYTADPEKDPNATRFDSITFDEVYNRGLKIMDLTATALCKENNLKVIVFNMDQKGNLLKILRNEKIGTIVYND